MGKHIHALVKGIPGFRETPLQRVKTLTKKRRLRERAAEQEAFEMDDGFNPHIIVDSALFDPSFVGETSEAAEEGASSSSSHTQGIITRRGDEEQEEASARINESVENFLRGGACNEDA